MTKFSVIEKQGAKIMARLINLPDIKKKTKIYGFMTKK